MIRIRPDPDSKHCKDELNSHLEIIYTNVSDCLPEMLKEKKDKKMELFPDKEKVVQDYISTDFYFLKCSEDTSNYEIIAHTFIHKFGLSDCLYPITSGLKVFNL